MVVGCGGCRGLVAVGVVLETGVCASWLISSCLCCGVSAACNLGLEGSTLVASCGSHGLLL
jgi:hypothetical protein